MCETPRAAEDTAALVRGRTTSRAAVHVSKRIKQKQKRTEEKSVTRGNVFEAPLNGALLNRTVGMYKPFSLERPPHGGERGHPDMQRDGPVSGQRHADWGVPASAPSRIRADPAAGDRRHRVEPRVV